MTSLHDIDLKTDLAGAAELLDRGPAAPQFAISKNRFHVRQGKARVDKNRRGIKKLIRPENARAVIPLLPGQPEDRLHCILRGDFVLCDLVALIIETHGPCRHLRIATLGLSAANAGTLASLQARGLVVQLTIVCSHYFAQVDKTTTYREVRAVLKDRCRFAVTRSHAKVILIPTARGDHFVIEGSANLRSSDNLEQMLVLNDAETHHFHSAWMDQLATDHAA